LKTHPAKFGRINFNESSIIMISYGLQRTLKFLLHSSFEVKATTVNRIT